MLGAFGCTKVNPPDYSTGTGNDAAGGASGVAGSPGDARIPTDGTPDEAPQSGSAGTGGSTVANASGGANGGATEVTGGRQASGGATTSGGNVMAPDAAIAGGAVQASGGIAVSVGGGAATGGGGGASGGMTGGTGGMTTATGGTATGTGGTATGAGGTVPAPPSLSGAAVKDFGNVEVGVTSTVATWTINNVGGSPSGTLMLTNASPAELMVLTNGCTGVLPAGGTCSLSVAVTPSAGGARSASLTMSASPGGSVTFVAAANGQYRLTVSVVGGGTVTSTPAGISCGTNCSILVDAGGAIALRATMTNGANLFFSGWTGACSSPARNCSLKISAPTTATATFGTLTNNLVFATSTTFPTNRGSAAAYDSDCNAVATAAGLNDAAGTAYIAYISDAASAAPSRLGPTAQGWVRPDGKPFAATQTSLISENAVLNPVLFDEQGNDLSNSDYVVLTGTTQGGVIGPSPSTCSNWTSSSATDFFLGGNVLEGPRGWTYGALGTCQSPRRLLCMGRTKTAPLAPVAGSGTKIWMTNTVFTVGGGQTPDQKCQAEMPVGVASALALIATTTRSAASVLDMAATYVRPDGAVVGTGATLAAGGPLLSGIWQSADLKYRIIGYSRAWTGQTDLHTVGTPASTCGNWLDVTQAAGVQGIVDTVASGWWNGITAPCGGTDSFGNDLGVLYCVAVP